MIDIFPAEIRRQLRRRGSVFGSAAFCGLFALGLLIWVIVSGNDSRTEVIDVASGLLLFAAVICSIVIGATAGSYDIDKGTMRYLALTGRPRWQLVLVRAPALLLTVYAVLLPAFALVLVAYLLAPGDDAPHYAFTNLFYGVPIAGFLFGVFSLAIGTFLKSSAVAIAVAIVLNFAGTLITALIGEYVSETAAKAMYPVLVGVVFDRQGSSDTLAFAPTLAALAVWLTALLGAAVLRAQRAEY